MIEMIRAKRQVEEIEKVKEFADLDRMGDYSHLQEVAKETDLSVGKVKRIFEKFRKAKLRLDRQ